MVKLTVEDIIAKIKNEETFEAVSEDYSFTIKIEEYVYYACGAVHNGHQFRQELWDNCLHTEYERWFEEDPETKEMVKSHPIVIARWWTRCNGCTIYGIIFSSPSIVILPSLPLTSFTSKEPPTPMPS